MLAGTDVQNIFSFIGSIFRLLDRAPASTSSMLTRRAVKFGEPLRLLKVRSVLEDLYRLICTVLFAHVVREDKPWNLAISP
jgi:hypothetical protein